MNKLLLVFFFPFWLSAQVQPPNIVLFMVDDMGWQDTSVPFGKNSTVLNERYRTPNMERLAHEGMLFTDAYATPVCTPTRVSLLTGMNAARHRVTNWTSPYKGRDSGKEDDIFEFVDWNKNGVSPIEGHPHTLHATPFPQLLQASGYYNIHVGKAHWGAMGTPAADPKNLGFHINIGGSATGHPASFYGKENYGNLYGKAGIHAVPDLEAYYGSETYLTEALTQEALKALDFPRKERKPFFLYLSHYAVHVPLHADTRYVASYSSLDRPEAAYASMIEGVDKSLGDLLAYLDKHELSENTVVIFMSDNGGLSLKPPRGGEAHSHNSPLRMGKGSVYEGGIRVPMLLRWPAVIKAGQRNSTMLSIEDFMPSILEMAGQKKYKVMQQIDGRSFVPVLKGKEPSQKERALLWHYPHHWGPTGLGINYTSAIRKGHWKLIYDFKSLKLKLYDLRSDIGELRDLSSELPLKTRELSDELTRLLKSKGAQMPRYKANGLPVAYPSDL